jgi:hypothetical protein
MSDDNPVSAARTLVEVVGEVLKAAGDDPQVKLAGSELGKTAVTITTAINNILLPIAAVNFAFKKARDYFEKRFTEDFEEKVNRIPAEEVIEPRASLAGPILQGIAFSHDETNLKDMYLNLLAAAMDRRRAHLAHPAFVEIIKQLNAREADLLRSSIDSDRASPIAEIRLRVSSRFSRTTTYQPLLRHLMDIVHTSTGEAAEEPAMAAMVENWIRLGLVRVQYGPTATGKNPYEWVIKRPEFLLERKRHDPDGKRIEIVRGIFQRTEFGKAFAEAVELRPTIRAREPSQSP